MSKVWTGCIVGLVLTAAILLALKPREDMPQKETWIIQQAYFHLQVPDELQNVEILGEVHWESSFTEETGHGDEMDYDLASDIVEEMNSRHDGLHYWIEPSGGMKKLGPEI